MSLSILPAQHVLKGMVQDLYPKYYILRMAVLDLPNNGKKQLQFCAEAIPSNTHSILYQLD
jgi:hypothetical protein